MQVLGLAELRLAEDFSSEGVQEWVFGTWKYTKFMQFGQVHGFGGDMAE